MSGYPAGNMEALGKIRNFSLVYLAGILLETVSAILIGSLALLRAFAVSPVMYLILLGSILAGSVLTLVALFWLRSGYRMLKGTSEMFKSPYTGTTLYFVGLILVAIGAVITIVPLALHPSAFTLPSAFLGVMIIVVGAIIAFVGTIMALIIGSFRLRDHFITHRFGTAGIMFIIGIFIPFISIAGVILLYSAANTLIRAGGAS